MKLKKDAEIRIATFKQQVEVNRKAWAEVEKLNRLLDMAVCALEKYSGQASESQKGITKFSEADQALAEIKEGRK